MKRRIASSCPIQCEIVGINSYPPWMVLRSYSDTLNIAHKSLLRQFFLPTFCRIFVRPVATTTMMSTHAQKRADVKSNQPTTRRGVASSPAFAERKKTMLRQAILSQRSEDDGAVVRKRRMPIAVRGWRGELMLRAQTCCGFTLVSITIRKPFGYIRQHPRSIISNDAFMVMP